METKKNSSYATRLSEDVTLKVVNLSMGNNESQLYVILSPNIITLSKMTNLFVCLFGVLRRINSISVI